MSLFDSSLQQLEIIRKIRNPENFNLVFMGDSWVGSGTASDNIFEQAVTSAVRYKPLLMIHGGDIVFSGTITGNSNPFVNFINQLNKFNTDKYGYKVPMFVTPGNHELDFGQVGPAAIKNYRDYIGPYDLHFNLDLPEYNLTMIGLNTLYQFIYNEYGLTVPELNFLKNSLALRRPDTFVAMHVPPEEKRLDWVDGDAFPDRRGRIGFYEIIKGNVSKVLVSHIHDFQQATVHHTDFILSGGAGATLNTGARNHIVVINIKNAEGKKIIKVRFVPVGWERASV